MNAAANNAVKVQVRRGHGTYGNISPIECTMRELREGHYMNNRDLSVRVAARIDAGERGRISESDESTREWIEVWAS